MNKEYKIISDLFRLVGYAQGVILGLSKVDNETYMMLQERMEIAYKYLKEQSNLILMSMHNDSKE